MRTFFENLLGWFIILGIIVFGLFIYVWFFTGGDNPTVTEKSNMPPATPIAVQAMELYGMYDHNEPGAKEKYNDKLVEISGIVALIEESGSKIDVKLVGSPTSAAYIGNDLISKVVVCKVDKNNSASIVDLMLGDDITVTGTVNGIGFLDVEVKDCTIG